MRAEAGLLRVLGGEQEEDEGQGWWERTVVMMVRAWGDKGVKGKSEEQGEAGGGGSASVGVRQGQWE